jgi:hypothetical protein
MYNMATKKKAASTIDQRVWNSNQSWHFKSIESIGDRKAKFYIRKNAYENQSHASVTLWDGDKWHEVFRIAGVELQTSCSYVEKGITAKAFAKDVAELHRVFCAVVGVK